MAAHPEGTTAGRPSELGQIQVFVHLGCGIPCVRVGWTPAWGFIKCFRGELLGEG